MISRRSLLARLAAIPFLGALVPRAAVAKPSEFVTFKGVVMKPDLTALRADLGPIRVEAHPFDDFESVKWTGFPHCDSHLHDTDGYYIEASKRRPAPQ